MDVNWARPAKSWFILVFIKDATKAWCEVLYTSSWQILCKILCFYTVPPKQLLFLTILYLVKNGLAYSISHFLNKILLFLFAVWALWTFWCFYRKKLSLFYCKELSLSLISFFFFSFLQLFLDELAKFFYLAIVISYLGCEWPRSNFFLETLAYVVF